MVRTKRCANKKSGGRKTIGHPPPRTKVEMKNPDEMSVIPNSHDERVKGSSPLKQVEEQVEGTQRMPSYVPMFPSVKKKTRSGAGLSMTELVSPSGESKGSQTVGTDSKFKIAANLADRKTSIGEEAPSPQTQSEVSKKGTSPLSAFNAESSVNSEFLDSLLENAEAPREGEVENMMRNLDNSKIHSSGNEKEEVSARSGSASKSIPETTAEEPTGKDVIKNVREDVTGNVPDILTPENVKEAGTSGQPSSEDVALTEEPEYIADLAKKQKKRKVPEKAEKVSIQKKKKSRNDSSTQDNKNVPPPQAAAEKEPVKAPRSKKSKSVPNQKESKNVPHAAPDNIVFHSEEAAIKWKIVSQRVIFPEKNLSAEAQGMSSIMELLEKADLLKTVTNIGNFYPQLVKEFIANLPVTLDCAEEEEYHKVLVRGKEFAISPDVFNEFLGRTCEADDAVPSLDILAKVITGGKHQCWPNKGSMPASDLTSKYAILYRIGLANWAPSSNGSVVKAELATLIYLVGMGFSVNFGEVVFEHLCRHAKSNASQRPIGFASLISGIILQQHPSVLSPSDVAGKRPGPIVISHKLFEGKHAPDVDRSNVEENVRENVSGNVMPSRRKNVEPKGKSSASKDAAPSAKSGPTVDLGPISAAFHNDVSSELIREMTVIDKDVANLELTIANLKARKKVCEGILLNMPNPSQEKKKKAGPSGSSSDSEETSSDDAV